MQPSDFSEASTDEVADLIRQIKTENIPVVFGSEIFPSDDLRTIATESGAACIDELSDDDLFGGSGDAEQSNPGLAAPNLMTVIPTLGGDASAFEDIDVSPVFDGSASAFCPQRCPLSVIIPPMP